MSFANKLLECSVDIEHLSLLAVFQTRVHFPNVIPEPLSLPEPLGCILQKSIPVVAEWRIVTRDIA
jgi:hypothetical protein